MKYILDLAVLVILILTVVFGYRRGFLQTVVQLLGCVAAFVIALSISTPASKAIFDSFVAESAETHLVESLNNATGGSVSGKLDAVIADLPKPIGSLLQNNTQLQATIDELGTSMSSSVETMAESVVQAVIRPIVVTLLQLLVFVLAFILLLLLAKLLTKLIKPVAKLPVIRQVDGILGAMLGAVKGALFVCVLVSLVQLIAAASSNTGPLTQAVLDDTVLVKYVASINPLAGIIA